MKKVEKKSGNKNKKRIIIISIIGIFLLSGIFLFLFLNNKKDKNNKKFSVNIPLIDNLNVEINSTVNLLSFIKDTNNLEIISQDEQIDTSVLGDKELVIKYKENNETKKYRFKIKIIDSLEPIMQYPEEINATIGEEIDLLKDVKVVDNSKEEITPVVEGEYDLNKVGTYSLKYVAVDSSSNKSEGAFTLIVNDKNVSDNANTNKKVTTSSGTKTTIESANKNTQSSYKDLYSMSDEEFLHLFDDLIDFAESLPNESQAETPSTNNSSGTSSEPESSAPATSKPSDYGHGPIVGSNILDVQTELVSEKYGVKIYKEIHPYQNIYEDGYTEDGSFTKTKVDFSGYNATTNDLRSEAESLVNKNWSIYEEHLKYVNEYRAEKGASPLTLDRTMCIAATIRALEMAYTNELSHTRPNKTQCFTIFNELGIGGTYQGENVAAGDATSKSVAESWRNSPGHYANMINTSFTKIGIGMTYLQGTTYGYYWAQIFSN